MRLGPATLAALPAEVIRPAYDRGALAPGLMHLGLGAFARCHLAEHTEDALAHRFGRWGIRAVNLRPPDLGAMLTPQAGLYIRELREGGARARRVIGAVIDAMTVTDDAALDVALARAADPAIRAVTLTVTEKGYCHIPATGRLDETHPDIRHDVAHPDQPRSVPGFVLAAIRRRRSAGHAPPAFLSCDNVPDNGGTLRRCVLALAAAGDPALSRWIGETVAFPCSMVDRIVPATRPEDIAALAAETGLTDRALTIGEPFRMWVIARDIRAHLPDWQAAGALLVDDVAPYESLKMRVVNGAQTGLCHLGHMAGHEVMAEVMADPLFAGFAARLLGDEIAPHLPRVAGIAPEDYTAQTLRRLRNPALRHSTAQIATDGSRKIRQRLLDPLADCLDAGQPAPLLELAVAGWLAHVGRIAVAKVPTGVADPILPEVAALRAATGDAAAPYVARMLALGSVFAADVARRPGLGDRLAGLVGRLWRDGSRAALAAEMAGGGR
jgi:fructuronate reductase